MNLSRFPTAVIHAKAKIEKGWRRTRRAVARIWGRLRDDHVIYLAGSLAFFSVTALIPISAISLSIFASYIDTKQEDIFFDYILDNIFPFSPENRIHLGGLDSRIAPPDTSGTADAQIANSSSTALLTPKGFDPQEVENTLKEKVREFTAQARNVGWVGLIFLIITGIWLFDSIEDAFNSIWRSEKRRPFARRFMTFWTVLTLMPLLMVGPILVDRYLRQTHLLPDDLTWLSSTLSWGSFILPYLLSWLAIWLLYVVVPNGVVAWKPAAVSSLFVAVMWQALKFIFAFYVVYGGMYKSVYGSLGMVALVLAWIYYTWWVILAGLEMTSYLQYPDWDQPMPSGDLAPEISLLYSWGGLYLVGRSFQSGQGGVSTESVAQTLSLHKTHTARLMENLEEKHILARDVKGLWYPAIPLSHVTWAEVARALDYEVDSASIRLADWLESALQARGFTEYHQDTRNLPSLAALLDQHLNSPITNGLNGKGEEDMVVIANPVFLPEEGSSSGPSLD